MAKAKVGDKVFFTADNQTREAVIHRILDDLDSADLLENDRWMWRDVDRYDPNHNPKRYWVPA